MSHITWLMAANIAVWLGMGAYIFFLARAQKNLENRLQMKEILDNE